MFKLPDCRAECLASSVLVPCCAVTPSNQAMLCRIISSYLAEYPQMIRKCL